MHLMPLKRYCLPEHFPVHRRSGLVSLSENLKTTSGESMAAPLDTSTSQEIWTPVLRFVSPTRKREGFVRSGAGIVADSVPEKEYEECINKARSSLKALKLAQEAEL